MNGHQRHGVNGAGGDSDLILHQLEKDADMSKQCLCPVISMTKRNSPFKDQRPLRAALPGPSSPAFVTLSFSLSVVFLPNCSPAS